MSTDGGATWMDCDLDEEHGAHAWRGFRTTWQAAPGPASLRVRATDASGRVQPTETPWNRGGFANNASLPIDVLVR